jgi:hypothetical protein
VEPESSRHIPNFVNVRIILAGDNREMETVYNAASLGFISLAVIAEGKILAAAGKVQSFGRGPARRWMTPPVPGFATTLLLPLPSD